MVISTADCPSMGQFILSTQLQIKELSSFFVEIFLLCEEMIEDTFSVQL